MGMCLSIKYHLRDSLVRRADYGIRIQVTIGKNDKDMLKLPKSQSHKMMQLLIAEYPGVQLSAKYGLMELIGTANRLAPSVKPQVKVKTCSLNSRSTRHKTEYDAVVLLPCLSETPPSIVHCNTAIDWLKRCHEKGSLICSVCSGGFLLAETGLLDDRSATTHWVYEEAFRAKFPRVELQFDRLIDAHPDVITAGGVMAWTDLGLHLIERFYGTSIMLEVSHLYLLEPGLRQQQSYASFIPRRDHTDDKIATIQRAIEQHINKRWNIRTMAERVDIAERTFLRRFKRATGLTPTEYLQQSRVAAARLKLETTQLSVEQVASSVGYSDTPAFARVFKSIVGLPPGGYRKRFGSD